MHSIQVLTFQKMLAIVYSIIVRVVVAYLKVVRRRKSSSADGTRGREHERGSPREIFEFLALLCAFLMGFYAFGTRFQSRFFAKRDIHWCVEKSNAKQNRFQIVAIFLIPPTPKKHKKFRVSKQYWFRSLEKSQS